MGIIRKHNPIDGLKIRYTLKSDMEFLRSWLLEPGILQYFSMKTDREIEFSVYNWVCYGEMECSITGIMNGEPCGIATLYLESYSKLKHRSEMGIIVSGKYRGKGIGSDLMHELFALAKNKFGIESIQLAVCGINPAIHFYEKLGFKTFCCQDKWIKRDEGVYDSRIFMEIDL